MAAPIRHGMKEMSRIFHQRFFPAIKQTTYSTNLTYLPCRCKHSAYSKKKKSYKYLKFFGGSLLITGGVIYVIKANLLPENLYRRIPLNVISRTWGKICQYEMHPVVLKQLLKMYIWTYGVQLNEAEEENLDKYKSIGEFFRRALKPHVRAVDAQSVLTSPADGQVLHFGKVNDGILEQVKGVTYSLKDFLGPATWTGPKVNVEELSEHGSDSQYFRSLGLRPGNELYHCVIYLSPGDYHRFHSSADWKITYRRHFPGELLSVHPSTVQWIRGLFNYNERVVYYGEWEHGFFSYTAVGATNVGSIKVYCDNDLMTNVKGKKPLPGYIDKSMIGHYGSSYSVKKGEMFGEFNLGSTIVLVFEAPKDFDFKIEGAQKVKVGQGIGNFP